MQPALRMHSWSHRSAGLEAGMQHGKDRQQLPLQLLAQYHSWYFTVSLTSTRNSSLSVHRNRFFCRFLALEMNTGKPGAFVTQGHSSCQLWLKMIALLQWENSANVHRKIILPQFLSSAVHFAVLLNPNASSSIQEGGSMISVVGHSLPGWLTAKPCYYIQSHSTGVLLLCEHIPEAHVACLSWNFIVFFIQAQNIWLLFSAERRCLKWKKSTHKMG